MLTLINNVIFTQFLQQKM